VAQSRQSDVINDMLCNIAPCIAARRASHPLFDPRRRFYVISTISSAKTGLECRYTRREKATALFGKG